MTTLSAILTILNEKAVSLGAVQYTPQNLMILVNSKNFWKCIEMIKNYTPQFQFLEQRTPTSIDVHLRAIFDQTWIFLTFRIVDLNFEFFNQFEIFFPSSQIYIEEIEKRN